MCSSLLPYVCDLHYKAIDDCCLMYVIFTVGLLLCSLLLAYVCDLHYRFIAMFFTAGLCM